MGAAGAGVGGVRVMDGLRGAQQGNLIAQMAVPLRLEELRRRLEGVKTSG